MKMLAWILLFFPTGLANFDGAIQLFKECMDLHSQTGNIAEFGVAYGNLVLCTAYREQGKI